FCQGALAQADGTPKLMECLHSACEPCVKLKIEEKLAPSRDFLGANCVTISCGACRLQCQPSNMIDQRFVLEKMEMEQAGSNGAAGELECNSCDDTAPATSYCADCAEFICDNCVLAHQRLKITKDHTIKSREEAAAELPAAQGSAHDMFCRDHPQERLALFCETCDRLTCRDCQLQHHRDHKYQFSTEMAAQVSPGRAPLSRPCPARTYGRVPHVLTGVSRTYSR
ncbi:jg617, partial [Pararge aegeria aegeria]